MRIDPDFWIPVAMIAVGLLIWTGLLVFAGLTAGNIAWWAVGLLTLGLYAWLAGFA